MTNFKDSIVGKIQSVQLIKSGETNGKKWNLYKVMIGDTEFTAFDSQFEKLIGAEGEWKFEITDRTDKEGVIRQNRKLFNLKVAPKPQNPTTSAQLDRIEKKLDTLIDYLKEPHVHLPMGEEIGGHIEEKVVEENLPF